MPIVRETLDRARTNATLVFIETNGPPRSAVNGYPVLSEEEFFAAEDKEKQFNIAIADSQVRGENCRKIYRSGSAGDSGAQSPSDDL